MLYWNVEHAKLLSIAVIDQCKSLISSVIDTFSRGLSVMVF